MDDDPYWDTIQERWDAIIGMYNAFRDKDQIIEFDITDQKIYSYPAGDYIKTLSERTRDQTAHQFAEAKKRNQFILFVKDTQNKRLRSYILDLPG